MCPTLSAGRYISILNATYFLLLALPTSSLLPARARSVPPTSIHIRTTDSHTGKMTVSTIILLVLGGICEFWIIFALVYAALHRHSGRPYLKRVGDALKFQLR
ncbi:hypothetical protein FB567DRAFT_547572 [Paraphoma chrysanthemicola]|uniref:Uncharacterized protein n=1 Tax=Paraphoma chrysanthemicola TaxID=798071 RepID=A0A8K0R9S0_9PLEO|nr:hypothetical protein FB567DRAFT_547572 [Paraphoma chrysanthemicola]